MLALLPLSRARARAGVGLVAAVVLQPVTPVPTGYQTRLRHPDGLIVEYVQHTEAAARFRDPDL